MDATVFRAAIQEAGSYIRSLRGQTLVVRLPAGLERSEQGIAHLADLVLLGHLGARLLLVFAPDGQPRPAEGMDQKQLQAWIQAVTGTQTFLVDAFNRALPGMRPRLVIASGVTARPAGVRDGHHLGHLGEIRSLDTDTLKSLLAAECTVLVPPLAPSLLSGYYALDVDALAAQLALQIGAKKLVLLVPGTDGLGETGDDRVYAAADLRRIASESTASDEVRSALAAAVSAGEGGVERVHLLDADRTGVLLSELYTRRGAGALVAQGQLEQVRPARAEDAAGLLQIIEPLEREGILVERGRDRLEQDIDHFWVLEMEGQVIGCCALLVHGDAAELATLAVQQDYRHSGRASSLLAQVEQRAREIGMARLFVFTTTAEDWFLERGFVRGQVADLPAERAALYNYRRNSVILVKQLTGD